jgi:hypothetical protein
MHFLFKYPEKTRLANPLPCLWSFHHSSLFTTHITHGKTHFLRRNKKTIVMPSLSMISSELDLLHQLKQQSAVTNEGPKIFKKESQARKFNHDAYLSALDHHRIRLATPQPCHYFGQSMAFFDELASTQTFLEQ